MGKKREKNILPTRLLEKKNSWWPEITHPSPQELNGRPLIFLVLESKGFYNKAVSVGLNVRS